MLYLTAHHDPDQPDRWDWLISKDYLPVSKGTVTVEADDPSALLIAVAEQELARRGIVLNWSLAPLPGCAKEEE